MCHESENQMKEILSDVKPTSLTKGLKLLAMTQDKNFQAVDSRFEMVEEKMKENFDNLDTKLDQVIVLLNKNIKETDEKIKKAEDKQVLHCSKHKEELASKFTKIDESVEVVSFLSKYPKILMLLGIGIIFLVGIALGQSKFLELFKIV